jgi:mutual gliding-motility protein MglA
MFSVGLAPAERAPLLLLRLGAMSLVNYSSREITCKIVYYGPGRSGKTTNLQWIHERVAADRKGELVSLATETDRTLFFDFLPVDLGTISGFRVRFQLYTVPGQVYYDQTRRLVLQGADGVVFVADSQTVRWEDNLDSFRNLQVNLLDQGMDPRTFPLCLQYNKRDIPAPVVLEDLDAALNFRGVPAYEAAAVSGAGVFETLRGISDRVLTELAGQFQPQKAEL